MDQPGEILLRTQNVNEMILSSADSFYCKRSLNADAEEYIIEQAELLPKRIFVSIIIGVPAGKPVNAEEIAKAVHKHFGYLREKSRRKLKETLQLGWRSLLIGIAFLAIMVLLVETGASLLSGGGGLGATIREFLIILGWVALWRPAELLLYEWFPHKRDMNLFGRLEKSEVRVVEEVR